MIDKLHRIASQVFNVPIEKINDESSPDTIKSWDSLAHINLILAVETEFGISLSPEDATEMLSVKLMRLILQEKGVAVHDE